MRRFKKILIFTLLLCVPPIASAGWKSGKIVELTTYLNGGVTVKIDSVHECGSDQISFESTADVGFDRVYSSMLTSQTVGASVDFAIQSCAGTTALVDRVVGH